MTRTRTAATESKGNTWLIAAAALLAAGTFAWYRHSNATPTVPLEPKTVEEVQQAVQATAQVNADDRRTLWETAVEKGRAQAATWPKTESDTIRAFWKAMIEKNTDQATTLCPGTRAEDFAPYRFFAPESLVAVGNPKPHPTEKNVTLWPVKVNFRTVPNKTIAMALYRLPDGRLAIDGRYTIWW